MKIKKHDFHASIHMKNPTFYEHMVEQTKKQLTLSKTEGNVKKRSISYILPTQQHPSAHIASVFTHSDYTKPPLYVEKK